MKKNGIGPLMAWPALAVATQVAVPRCPGCAAIPVRGAATGRRGEGKSFQFLVFSWKWRRGKRGNRNWKLEIRNWKLEARERAVICRISGEFILESCGRRTAAHQGIRATDPRPPDIGGP